MGIIFELLVQCTRQVHNISIRVIRRNNSPPCYRWRPNKGGNCCEKEHHFAKIFAKTPKFSAPSAPIYYVSYGSFVYLPCFRTTNDCFSSCVFFRACGALFIFPTFCACVESAIAACRFENCLGRAAS